MTECNAQRNTKLYLMVSFNTLRDVWPARTAATKKFPGKNKGLDARSGRARFQGPVDAEAA